MIPVPGYSEGTPYGARSSLWSCRRDRYGRGIHTGVDFPAPTGARVVAARPGIAVWTYHSWFFGYHQLEIHPGDGTRDFYAHMSGRTVANGAHVEAGQHVGYVGAEGHVTGSHLHFERHAVSSGPWTCSIVRDPTPSVNWKDDADMPLNKDDLDKIRAIVKAEMDNVLDLPVNKTTGKDAEPAFVGVDVREALKRIFRHVVK